MQDLLKTPHGLTKKIKEKKIQNGTLPQHYLLIPNLASTTMLSIKPHQGNIIKGQHCRTSQFENSPNGST